ncbi:hypothetical protein NE612_01365 [Oscillibacter valericigenes]|nr:hypothetical protein [Oscillibacter valericigenes]
MPRTKLGIPTPAQQRETLKRVIKVSMAANDVDSYTELAGLMGMSRQALSRRMNDGGWKFEELCRLIRVLKMDQEQVSRMMGAISRPVA